MTLINRGPLKEGKCFKTHDRFGEINEVQINELKIPDYFKNVICVNTQVVLTGHTTWLSKAKWSALKT